jgi:hypothetical protein
MSGDCRADGHRRVVVIDECGQLIGQGIGHDHESVDAPAPTSR